MKKPILFIQILIPKLNLNFVTIKSYFFLLNLKISKNKIKYYYLLVLNSDILIIFLVSNHPETSRFDKTYSFRLILESLDA